MLINEMSIFYYVVQLQSFSQAAERLGLSKSFVSKCITKLERDTQSQLLTRSTRHLSLTESGAAFYQHCQAIVEQAQQAYDTLANLRGIPAGTLKITAPTTMGQYLLAPILTAFVGEYPQVKLNVTLENRIVDIIQHGYDLALRSAILPDSNLIAQQVCESRYILCASPAYLQAHAPLLQPQQLSQHKIALYKSTKSAAQLKMTQREHQFTLPIEPCFECNNLELIKQMVLADYCIGVLPEFMVANLIEQKRLVPCLIQYQIPAHPLYVIYPQRAFNPLKVTAFIKLLKLHLLEPKLT